ncbi:MAG: hypothetical protein QNK37_04010 [Acidobacteriota bacterium]|nr:hypothetical protein [Acidobacteriota bacterium]
MDAAEYLSEALARNPAQEAASIVALRARFLKLDHISHGETRDDMARERIADLLECLRNDFWNEDAKRYRVQLLAEDLDRHPDLKARFNRLEAVYPFREQFHSALNHGLLEPELLKFYGQVLVAGYRQAARLKDLFTDNLHVVHELKRVKRWVRILRAQEPGLYGLEKPWLDTILQSQPGRWRPPQERKFRRGFWLPIVLGVAVGAVILAALLLLGLWM